MPLFWISFILFRTIAIDVHGEKLNLPIVVNTWPFTNATSAGSLLTIYLDEFLGVYHGLILQNLYSLKID